MSAIASPESSTAAWTAWSAYSARGTSADRVILEKPTPLTATLHLFSHIQPPLRHCVGAGPSEARSPRLRRRRGASLTAPRSPRLRRRRGASLTAPLPLRLHLVWHQPELRQGDVIVELLEDHLDAPPHLCLGIGSVQQIASQQGAFRLVEFDNDAGIGYGCRKALVTGMVHDGVGIDGAFALYGFEREVG